MIHVWMNNAFSFKCIREDKARKCCFHSSIWLLYDFCELQREHSGVNLKIQFSLKVEYYDTLCRSEGKWVYKPLTEIKSPFGSLNIEFINDTFIRSCYYADICLTWN